MFLCLINSCSDVQIAICTAIITSSITFLGVWIANNGNNKRLKIQLQHDLKQKDNDLKIARIEELYIYFNKFSTHLAGDHYVYLKVLREELNFNEAFDLIIEASKQMKHDPDRLAMLIHMYFPDLNKNFDTIVTLNIKLNKIVDDYKRQYKQGNTDGTEFIKPFQLYASQLDQNMKSFSQLIINLNSSQSLTTKHK